LILRNTPGESYSGIRALADYLFALTNTNKLSSAIAGEAIDVKILILTLISTDLVTTSFYGHKKETMVL